MKHAGRAIIVGILMFVQAALTATAQVMPEYGGMLKAGARPGPFRFPSIPPATQAQPGAPIGDIAFVTDGDIYTITVDGKHIRRLTTDGRNAFPVWSPNSRYIAFARAEEPAVKGGAKAPSASLWVITSDGKYSKPIAKAEPRKAVYPVAWLPDGKGLAVAMHYLSSDISPVLKVVTLDGCPYPPYRKWLKAAERAGFIHQFVEYDPEELTHGKAAAFSPDGKRMILTACTEYTTDAPRPDLFRMNMDGTALRRIAEVGRISIDSLRWHPKMPRLLSAEEHYLSGDEYDAGIWLRNVDGAVIRKLVDATTASYGGMDWSSKGGYIIFQMTDAEYPRFEHPSEFRSLSSHSSIWVMKSDGTGKYRVMDNACHPNWR